MGESGIPVAAEITLQDASILSPIEDCAPRLEFAHPIRCFLGVQFRHAPLIDVLTAAHRISEMNLPAVSIIDIGKSSGNPAFGHNSVSLAQKRFTNKPYRYAGGRCFNRGAQSGTTRTNHEHVVFDCLIIRHESGKRLAQRRW